MKICHISLPQDLHNWLQSQGDGNLETGIMRVALAAGYDPNAPKWTVKQAAEEAKAHGYNISVCTIGAALRAGNIRGATQPARDWVLDSAGFMDWLKNRYNPRRPVKAQAK